MKVVITGSSGFIGAALARHLCAKAELYDVTTAIRTSIRNDSIYSSLPRGDVLDHLGEISNAAKCEELGHKCLDNASRNFDEIEKKKYNVTSNIVF